MSSQSTMSPTPTQRPKYSYKALIKMAINSSPQKALPSGDIIDWISENFPYYQTDRSNWCWHVRSALSDHISFFGLERPRDHPGRGKLWVVAPEGYKPGDPIIVPPVGFVGEGYHSADASRPSQSSTSSAPIQKPNFSFKDLITMAINSSPQKALPTRRITDWISENIPYYRTDRSNWRGRVRRTLIESFVVLECPGYHPGLGNIWVVAPEGYKKGDPISLPNVGFVGEADHSAHASRSSQNSTSSTPTHRRKDELKELITMAINSSPQKALPTCDIIDWISENFSHYRTDLSNSRWRVRCNITLTNSFIGLKRPRDLPGRGKLWVVAPEGYKKGDPISLPHVGFVGEGNHSADASRPFQSSTSSTLIQQTENELKDLIMLAINSSPQKVLPTSDIIDWISGNFPFYQKDMQDWQKSVREILTTEFYKAQSPAEDNGFEELWAELPTLEELYRLREDMATGDAVMANELIVEAATKQQPENMPNTYQ